MSSLKHKTAKAIGWDISGTLLTQGSSFIISIFLARLLEPAEFGLVGMALVFISISNVFTDIGFSSALVQSKYNTNLTYSSVFYLNIFAGFLLTIIFFFCAPLVGLFYKNEQITELVKWLSLTFIFNSFNRVQNAILIKNLKFKVLTIRLLIATVIGGVLGIGFAFAGFGVYSLVIQNLTSALMSTILLWSITEWRPDFNFSWAEIKKLFSFSSYAFLDLFSNSIFLRLDVLVIGKIFSPTLLGFYSRASSLKDQVTKYSSASITKVFYPTLSSLQDDHEEFSRIYFKVLSVIAFISYGLTGILYILGKDIIIILFGNKWIPSVIIFQVLVLSVCNQPLNSMMWNAFMSKGKSKENFYLGLIKKTIGVFPFLIAYFYGIFEFTIGLVLSVYIITILNIFLLNKFTNLSIKVHFQKIFEGMIPLVLTIVLFHFINFEHSWTRLIYALGFISFYLFFNWYIKAEGLLFIWNNKSLLTNKLNKFFSKSKQE